MTITRCGVLTFQLDEGQLIDGAAQRLVVQGEIQQRQTGDLLDTLGAAPGAGGGRRPHRQHAADLQEGRAVGLLQRLDAEGEQRRGRLQMGGASGHLVTQRAHPGLAGLPSGLDQSRLSRLQETHQIRHPILDLSLERHAFLLRIGEGLVRSGLYYREIAHLAAIKKKNFLRDERFFSLDSLYIGKKLHSARIDIFSETYRFFFVFMFFFLSLRKGLSH